PACYGNGGTLPTNTDANLVLGILTPHGLLGGRKPLDVDLARAAIEEHVAKPLGLTVEQAAIAIHEVQNAQAGDLLRRAVIEVGLDPRDFVAYAFGGAGPAHCAGYCRDLGVREVVVPLGPVASAFSAYGLASSDIVISAELSAPSRFPIDTAAVQAHFDRLEADLRDRLQQQGLEFVHVRMQREIDMRYTSQMHEFATPVAAGALTDADCRQIVESFEGLYERVNGPGSGYSTAGVEALTYRVRAMAELGDPPKLPIIELADTPDPSPARIAVRPVCMDVQLGYVPTDIYDYSLLKAGYVIEGPAVVEVPTTVVAVPSDTRGRVDELGNLVLTYK
ncbi:MAG: hydantoinase/oxoprolinase family protein, partial [Nocardioidaceae bacterium]